MAYEPPLLCHMNRFYWGWGVVFNLLRIGRGLPCSSPLATPDFLDFPEFPRTSPEVPQALPRNLSLWDPDCLVQGPNSAFPLKIGHGEVRVYRGTGVSRRVRRTTWERSLENWELQIPCFEEFFWGGNTLGLVPASLLHTLGYACTFYAPTSPPPRKSIREGARDTFGSLRPSPQKYLLLLPLSIFRGNAGIRALYQAIGIPTLAVDLKIATRAATYRSLRALQARKRREGSQQGSFQGSVEEKSQKITEKV